MKTPLVVLALGILVFPSAIYAQSRPGSGGTSGGGASKPTTPTNPTSIPGTRTDNPFPEMDRPHLCFRQSGVAGRKSGP